MELSAELDRGDIWYDESPVARRIEHRPALILYVDDGGTRRPLIRWATTIGGWSDVQTPSGDVERRWNARGSSLTALTSDCFLGQRRVTEWLP